MTTNAAHRPVVTAAGRHRRPDAELRCPACGGRALTTFYEQRDVPAHSVLLMRSAGDARTYARGTIALAFCRLCGFISNTAFDPTLTEYSTRYEETQSFSPTFTTFHRRLARQLIDRYQLRGKAIVEIGCGKGEFLSLLCEMGGNRGVGFDPAYVHARDPSGGRDGVRFISDVYSDQYAHLVADFICCKMTLEHVPRPANLLRAVHRSIGPDRETIVFFQVPDARRVLRDTAFWDVYYEHCSYFSPGSLARLFRRHGFEVRDTWTAYDDQYLMIEAVRAHDGRGATLAVEETPAALAREVAQFATHSARAIGIWRERLAAWTRKGRRVAIWGGGSKAVAFLTTLGLTREVEYVIDVNPYKHGTYTPGTGHPIVPPAFAQRHPPDVVVVMNPVYQAEIARDLHRMGLAAELCAMTAWGEVAT